MRSTASHAAHAIPPARPSRAIPRISGPAALNRAFALAADERDRESRSLRARHAAPKARTVAARSAIASPFVRPASRRWPQFNSCGAERLRVRPNATGIAWWYLRISGLLVIALVLGHLFVMHYANAPSSTTSAFVLVRWSDGFWRDFDWALLLLALTHGLVGMRNVIADAVPSRIGRRASEGDSRDPRRGISRDRNDIDRQRRTRLARRAVFFPTRPGSCPHSTHCSERSRSLRISPSPRSSSRSSFV